MGSLGFGLDLKSNGAGARGLEGGATKENFSFPFFFLQNSFQKKKKKTSNNNGGSRNFSLVVVFKFFKYFKI